MTHSFRFSRALPAFLVAGALSIPLLASCGGGGGGGGGVGSKSSAINAATPVPTSATSNGTCNNASYTPNYASSVSLLHWSAFPLRVHFTANDQLSATRRAVAIAGFNRWVSATGNRADYTVVSNASNANVTVSFYRFTGGSGDTLGTTTVSYDSTNTIRRATVEIGITGAEDDTATAAHEYGHLLGVTGHSPAELDLMYFTGNLSGQVTTSDLNTALTAYCDNFNRNAGRTSAAVGPLKTIVIH